MFLEYQSIVSSFARLAPQSESDLELIAERQREQRLGKSRLARLVDDNPGIREALDQTLGDVWSETAVQLPGSESGDVYRCIFTGVELEPGLRRLVTEGRRSEFGGFRAFGDDRLRESIPDP